MPEPHLRAIGRAVPARRYTQAEVYAHNPWADSPLIDRLFLESPIETRAFFVPPDWYRTPRGLTDTNTAWRQGALSLAGEALSAALAGAGLKPADLAMLGVTSVTGYATPGLDLLLARDLGLRADVARAHFNCIGCHAAVPLLRTAADYVRARPTELAAAVAVEICSACFADDPSAQNLVALSLFADGAAAAVVGAGGPGPAIVDFGSRFDFAHLEALAFELRDTGFRIVLDPSIPDIIGRHIGSTVDELLERHGLTRDRVSTWCFHPGGARILDAVEERLGLTASQMRHSRQVFRRYGNMSSPSVLFVLAEALRAQEAGAPDAGVPGSHGVLAAFGPGLGIEVALLRFDEPAAARSEPG